MKKRNRNLRLEKLDRRDLMAVDVSPVGDTLYLNGDAQRDKVAVYQLPAIYINGAKQVPAGPIYVIQDDGVTKRTDVINWGHSQVIRKIVFRGGEGGDSFTNSTNLRSNAYGEAGNDRLFGGSNTDRLFGGDGEDELDGKGGRDYLYGGQHDDWLYGGSSSDVLWGQGGDDELWGEGGNDELSGGSGDDDLYGDAGHDLLKGGSGNDKLLGGAGNDRLFGNSDDDRLLGGTGVDYLYGGEGDDSFIGGDNATIDIFMGEEGADRFLVQRGDIVMDPPTPKMPFIGAKPEDATIEFRDGSKKWTQQRMEVVDRAFAELQETTDNARLLKDPVTNRPMIFQFEKEIGSVYNNFGKPAGKNGLLVENGKQRRYIWLTPRGTNIPTVIHEIGHNWHSTKALTHAGLSSRAWGDFQRISGWRRATTDPIVRGLLIHSHDLSLDRKYIYRRNSGFLGHKVTTADGSQEEYAKTNPREDFAETFEAWFDSHRSNASRTQADRDRRAKLAIIDDLIDCLT